MFEFKENKWKISCITMAVALLIIAVYSVALSKQNNELKREAVNNVYSDWYQLYRLTELVDKNYIQNNFQDPIRFRLYVNQASHHFSSRSDEITVNMRNLLVIAYDPLFTDLSQEKGPFNLEEATKLLKEMNNEIMLISRSIMRMPDDEKLKLLDQTSAEYMKVNSEVKAISEKYQLLTDDYFRKNKK
jgi:hypothetical protein